MADTKKGQLAVARGWSNQRSGAGKRAPKRRPISAAEAGTPF